MTDRYQSPFSVTQQKVLAYAPKTGALLSIACSIFMIQRILRDQFRRKKVYHRIIVALSVHTIILCFWHFLGTWPMPTDSLTATYGAMGTELTCTAQGFMMVFETMTVASLYLSLSIFSFLAVRNDFKEKILRKYEFWLHTLVYVIPLTLACIALKQGFINPAFNMCFIATVPPGCSGNDSIECLHKYAGFNEYGRFCSGYFCLTLIVALSLTVILYFSVRRKEIKNESLRGKKKYRENARKLKSRIIATQAGLYFGAFICSYIIPLICRNLSLRLGTHYFSLYALGSILNGIQGVLNLFAYQRLLLSKRSIYDHSMKPKLDSLEQRISSSRGCAGKISCLGNERKFSIFDGTNASEHFGGFIDELSQCEEEKSEEGKEALKEKVETNEEFVSAI